MIDLSNCRLLAVDDTESNIDVLVDFLSDDYTVSVALDGETALNEAIRNPPDLILLDIMMPGIDGYEVCRRLKANPELTGIPVIFLSAMSQSEDIVKGLKLGAVDYVVKPFDKDELQQRVRTHLKLKLSQEIILRQSNEYKELIHILCHDLINPIGFIQSIIEYSISKPDILEDSKELMLTSAKNALRVINLVRELRAIEEGKITLELSPVNLAEAVDESISVLHGQFANKKIQPKVQIDQNITVLVERSAFINSVLNNLFTNAIKFSYAESTINVAASREGEHVVLIVSDQGIGIPKATLDDIFDYSKSVSRVGTANEVGTGFGMPLIKKFMDIFGGEINIYSTEEKPDSTEHGTQVRLALKPN